VQGVQVGQGRPRMPRADVRWQAPEGIRPQHIRLYGGPLSGGCRRAGSPPGPASPRPFGCAPTPGSWGAPSPPPRRARAPPVTCGSACQRLLCQRALTPPAPPAAPLPSPPQQPASPRGSTRLHFSVGALSWARSSTSPLRTGEHPGATTSVLQGSRAPAMLCRSTWLAAPAAQGCVGRHLDILVQNHCCSSLSAAS